MSASPPPKQLQSPWLSSSFSPWLRLSPHSTVAQWTAPTAISHHYHLPSWATASHYHAALLIFLSYQLANHKPLSLMAWFWAACFFILEVNNRSSESFRSPDDCYPPTCLRASFLAPVVAQYRKRTSLRSEPLTHFNPQFICWVCAI